MAQNTCAAMSSCSAESACCGFRFRIYSRGIGGWRYPDDPVGRHVVRLSGDVLKGEGQQRVSRQDCNILAVHLRDIDRIFIVT